MPYNATWTDGDTSGALLPATHTVRFAHVQELVEAVNRRRGLVYQPAADFSSLAAAGGRVRRAILDGSGTPAGLRDNIRQTILQPATGVLATYPPTPIAMQWLWPLAGGDENMVIVAANPQSGQVSLFEHLNGTADWTDANPSPNPPVRAVHFNELRRAVELLRRGRWLVPVCQAGGIFSVLPDTPWMGGIVGRSGSDEIRALGFVLLRDGPLGLQDVTVRATTSLQITTDAACEIEVRHCLRPLNSINNLPTWRRYDPDADQAWTFAGGTGSDDSTALGTIALPASTRTSFSTASLMTAVQEMIDGSAMNFLFRRVDSGPQTVALTAELSVEFDLDAPPN